ncbi:hypothetical protein GCM10020331_015460 [Ectobacillus funiculus]
MIPKTRIEGQQAEQREGTAPRGKNNHPKAEAAPRGKAASRAKKWIGAVRKALQNQERSSVVRALQALGQKQDKKPRSAAKSRFINFSLFRSG